MGKYLLPILIVLAGMGVAAFVLTYKNTAATTAPASEGGLPERAVAAYNRGDFEAALPLLREWAAQPEVRSDLERLKIVMAYLHDVELQREQVAINPTHKIQPKPLNELTRQASAAAQSPASAPSLAERTPHEPLKPGEVRLFAIKELGNFAFDPEKDADVPADVKALSGSRIRVRGFMIPLTQAETITDFALVPDLFSCCFGQPPGPNHTITARTPKDKTVNYTIDEVIVEGTLKVNVKREDNYTYSIFELDALSVKLAPIR